MLLPMIAVMLLPMAAALASTPPKVSLDLYIASKCPDTPKCERMLPSAS